MIRAGAGTELHDKAVNNDGGDIRNAVFFNGCTAKFRRREHDGLLIVATGIMVAVTAMSVIEYQKYGAFYDASWRSPDVEQHFLFDSKSNQDLEAQWLSDPENFPWAEARICFVNRSRTWP